MNKLQVFTHNSAGDDYSKKYGYSIIAYQFGKRIFVEVKDCREALEAIEDNEAFSVSLVITPNGEAWKPRDFVKQWEMAVGLDVPEPSEPLMLERRQRDAEA